MPKATKKSIKKKTILIVEDEHPIARTLQLKLENSGYGTLLAADGSQALQALDQSQVDLILLDLVMPVMDGFAVLEELKKAKSAPPIVIITNLGQEEDAKRCLSLGAKDYFIKAEMPLSDIVGKLAIMLS